MTLSDKSPGEIIHVTFEMKNLTAAPLTPTVTITQLSGPADSNVATMAVGAPQISGTQVRQKVQGGLNGCNYAVKCQIDTTEGYRYVEVATLPVRNE